MIQQQMQWGDFCKQSKGKLSWVPMKCNHIHKSKPVNSQTLMDGLINVKMDFMLHIYHLFVQTACDLRI